MSRRKQIRKTLFGLLAFGLCPLALTAEMLYFKQPATVETRPLITASVWTNAAGATPASITAADELVISYGTTCEFQKSHTAVAAKLHIGAVDWSSSGSFRGYGNSAVIVDSLNVAWHNGQVSSRCWSCAQIQPWTVTVDGSENGAQHIWCYNKKQTGSNDTATYNVAWGLSGQLIGDANQIVSLKLVAGGCTSDPKNYIQQFPFVGDNTGWLGKLVVSDCANFVLGHANAAGSLDAARADAITLGTHARFAVWKEVTPNAARGITISGTDVRFLARTFPYGPYADCTDYTLMMPICGTYGFSKTGPGRVALGGAYSAGAIVVEEGTLEILASATMTAGTAITVKSGASLVGHQSLDALAITQEEGATVRRVADPIVVPFDNATTNATPAVLHDEIFTITNVACIVLSEAIALPQHDGFSCKVLTYAGNQTLSPEMFGDATEKTHGLPKTSFRIVSENGAQSVYLDVRPVVVSVADIPYQNGVNINGTDAVWSDSAVAHSDADYLFTHVYESYNGSANAAFNGDSLTLAEGVFSSAATANKFLLSDGGPIVISPPFKIKEGYSGSRAHRIAGKLHIEGSYGDTEALNFEATYSDPARATGDTLASVILEASLSGAGTLALTARRVKGLTGLAGDNSAYMGRITMAGRNEDTLSSGMRVRVNSAANFGGRLDEFKFDSLTMTSKAFLYPLNDVTLEDNVNRGLYVNGAGVECQEGITFESHWPLRLAGTFSKIGPGTLKIAGATTYGADGTGASGTMEVREGTLAILSDAAAAGLSLVFSNETTLAVGYGLEKGLTVAPTALAAGGAGGVVNLTVDSGSLPVPAPKSIAITVATLPSGSADISGLFRLPDRAGKYRSLSLVKKSVEVESVTYDQYVLEAEMSGMIISFR